MEVTERRTKEDFAHQMRWLVDEVYPDVPVIRMVLENTHRMASLYDTFPPAEARRIAKRGVSLHPQVAVGSTWRIEFSVFSRGCLGQRLPDEESLCREGPWKESGTRHKPGSTGASAGARAKLHRLYPL